MKNLGSLGVLNTDLIVLIGLMLPARDFFFFYQSCSYFKERLELVRLQWIARSVASLKDKKGRYMLQLYDEEKGEENWNYYVAQSQTLKALFKSTFGRTIKAHYNIPNLAGITKGPAQKYIRGNRGLLLAVESDVRKLESSNPRKRKRNADKSKARIDSKIRKRVEWVKARCKEMNEIGKFEGATEETKTIPYLIQDLPISLYLFTARKLDLKTSNNWVAVAMHAGFRQVDVENIHNAEQFMLEWKTRANGTVCNLIKITYSKLKRVDIVNEFYKHYIKK